MNASTVWSSIENSKGALSIMNAIDSTMATCSGSGEDLSILGKIKRFNEVTFSLMTYSMDGLS